MCEVIDQLVENVNNSRLGHKEKILQQLNYGKGYLKTNPAENEVDLTHRLNYYKNQVRIWKTNQLNRKKALRKLKEYEELNKFNRVKYKVLNKLRINFKNISNRIKKCQTMGEFESIRLDIEQLF